MAVIALAGSCLSGLRQYTVLSGSMEPEIQGASVVYIDVKDKEGEVGKVVALQMETTGASTFVVHRIIDEKEKGFVTKGDNNDMEDLVLLKSENIIGAYRYSIPKLGYVFTNKAAVLVPKSL